MAAPSSPTPTAPCPCTSGQPFGKCCAPLLAGEAAPSAEALMRSRYTAYALEDEAYLLLSWHVSTRPQTLELTADAASTPPPRWIGLQIKRHENTAADAAIVEFVARYRIGGRAFRMHETSRFVREAGHWRYVDGTVHSA